MVGKGKSISGPFVGKVTQSYLTRRCNVHPNKGTWIHVGPMQEPRNMLLYVLCLEQLWKGKPIRPILHCCHCRDMIIWSQPRLSKAKREKEGMLDINLFRVEKGGNPEAVKASQRKRGKSPELVDTIIDLDRTWVKLRFDVDECNKLANKLQASIAERLRAKQDAEDLKSERKAVLEKKVGIEKEMTELEATIKTHLQNMGNIVHEDVPVSMDEKDNGLVKLHQSEVFGEARKRADFRPHHQVLAMLDGYDGERGAKVAGHRGYFLKNLGVKLNQALINYGIDFLMAREYNVLQTPFMMRKDLMAKCAQLEEYDETLYRIDDDGESGKYLIATSEQPIATYHSDEWFDEPSKQLPMRYAGYSTCFRKEAGSHGKDTWGLFRIHQFEKVEQFVLCEPEHSWAEHERMLAISAEFMESLGFSYRVISIVSGALNNAAAKKYDLEAWFPAMGDYRELVSCSNCTDYQARRLEIRCGTKKMGEREKRYVHCLNSTLCATERALCCLLENWQTAEGLVIPPVLRPYMNGMEFAPFVRSAEEELSKKVAEKL